MLAASAGPNGFRRYFIRNVAWPLAIVVFILLFLAAFGLFWTTSKSNEIALRQQINVARTALEGSADRLAYEQEGVATWDQLVGQIARKPLDILWFDTEIGSWLEEGFSHDMTFALGTDGRPVYAFVSGQARPPADFEHVRNVVAPLIEGARARTNLSSQAKDMSAWHADQPPRLTRPDTVYDADIVRINGRPAVASVMPIRKSAADGESPLPLLVSVRFLNDAYLQQVAAWNRIDGLRFSESAAGQASEARLALTNRSGERIGYFFWEPDLPGEQLLSALGPLFASLMSILLIVVGLLARSLWKSGKRLAIAAVDLQASKAQAQHLAFHDVLTGLPNRALFNDRLDHALARARRGHPLAIFTLNLDRFKQVNDSLGHAMGDMLILQVAARLGKVIREMDTVARVGGDEFSILLCDASEPGAVEGIAERILAAVDEPFQLLDRKIFVGVSIGVVRVPEAGWDRDDLLRKANVARHRAKSEGASCYRIFKPPMDSSIKLRVELEQELREAIATGKGMRVYYQPEVAENGHTIVGFEALLRWEHPIRGMVPPDHFIPIAEETGLISELGDFVLAEVCRVARRWPDLFVAVNLSPVQFRSTGLAARIIEIISSGRCSPLQIELEITENALLGEDENVRTALATLRESGFRIALDDFGTGYSSLSYLRQFKVDKIKIDRSFTQNLGHDHEAAAIIASMVTLGHAMGLTVTAEGVENRTQIRLLSAAGCDELQGYFFSRPMPEEDVAVFVARRRAGKQDAA